MIADAAICVQAQGSGCAGQAGQASPCGLLSALKQANALSQGCGQLHSSLNVGEVENTGRTGLTCGLFPTLMQASDVDSRQNINVVDML